MSGSSLGATISALQLAIKVVGVSFSHLDLSIWAFGAGVKPLDPSVQALSACTSAPQIGIKKLRVTIS